jgi:hypothetical protein
MLMDADVNLLGSQKKRREETYYGSLRGSAHSAGSSGSVLEAEGAKMSVIADVHKAVSMLVSKKKNNRKIRTRECVQRTRGSSGSEPLCGCNGRL